MTIEIKNISLKIDNKNILKNINLTVNSGEILSIIGPNGAGKTSLIDLVSGDNLPSKGQIIYDNKDLSSLTLEEKSRIRSVMGQFSKIAFDFKVKEVIQFGWVENGVEIFSDIFEDIILRISKMCNVEDLLDRNINSLSGGELKRVQLAKTLVQLYSPSSYKRKKKYALLDEPLANLDLFYEIEVLKIVQKVSREQGVGVLLIIHDLNLAAKFSDRIALLHSGEIKDYGKPKAILKPSILKKIYNINMKVQKNPFRVFHY